MNCNKCGKGIPENLNYCPTCKINEANNMNNLAFGNSVENKVNSQLDNQVSVSQPNPDVINAPIQPVIGTQETQMNTTNETLSSDSLTIVGMKNNVILNIILFVVSIFLLYITSTFIVMLMISSIPFLNIALRLLIYILMFNSLSNVFSGKERKTSFFKQKTLVLVAITILLLICYYLSPKLLTSSDSKPIILFAQIIYYQLFIIIPAIALVLINTALNYKSNPNVKKITRNTFIIIVILISVLSLTGLFNSQSDNLEGKMVKGKTACFVCLNLRYDDFVVYNDKIYYSASYTEIYVANLDGTNNELFFKNDDAGIYLSPKFVMDNKLFIRMYGDSIKTFTVDLNSQKDIKSFDYSIAEDIYNDNAYWYTDAGIYKANLKTGASERLVSSTSIQKVMPYNNDVYYLRWVESLKRQVIYKNNDNNEIYQYQYGTSNAASKVQIMGDNLYVLDGSVLVKINLSLDEIENKINMPSGNDNIKLTFGNSGIIAQIINSETVKKYDYDLKLITDSSTKFIADNNLDVYSDFEYLGNNLIALFYSKNRPDGSAEETMLVFNEKVNKTEKYVDIISYTYDNENIYIIKNDKNSSILKIKINDL